MDKAGAGVFITSVLYNSLYMKVIIKKVTSSIRYSYLGLSKAFRLELSFRLEVYVAVIAVITAALLPVTLIQKSYLISAVLLVLLVELMNTAIEQIVNCFGRNERSNTYGYIKDCGSGAVFLALCIAIIIWLAVVTDLFLI